MELAYDNLKGTEKEMEFLFENFNVRLFSRTKNERYDIRIRVCEDYKHIPTKTIRGLIRLLTLQEKEEI